MVKEKSVARLPMPSPEQVRAARAWLGMSQDDLAAAANALVPDGGCSRRTLIRFETNERRTNERTLSGYRDALEARGIEFLFDGGRPSGIMFVRTGAAPAARGAGRVEDVTDGT